jgi:monoamine oxidase
MLKQATRRAAFEKRATEGTAARADGGPISRRELLAGAAAAGASLLLPLPSSAAEANIAIIGAGLAGLTAAHELKTTFQLNADVYEGNTRVGGRCFTARGIFAQNQIAEHGGELIDTDHHAIRHLAHRLGLKLTDVRAICAPM